MSLCLRMNDVSDGSGSVHLRHPTKCVMCLTAFCLSCRRDCPSCHWGEGLDRRATRRVEVLLDSRVTP